MSLFLVYVSSFFYLILHQYEQLTSTFEGICNTDVHFKVRYEDAKKHGTERVAVIFYPQAGPRMPVNDSDTDFSCEYCTRV